MSVHALRCSTLWYKEDNSSTLCWQNKQKLMWFLQGFGPNYEVRRIISEEQESMLENYLIRASNMCYGVTPVTLKLLVYEYGVANSITILASWSTNKRADKDWFSGYMKRHQRLSLRRPEPTSLSPATSFNKNNVGQFYDNLDSVYKNTYFCHQRSITWTKPAAWQFMV